MPSSFIETSHAIGLDSELPDDIAGFGIGNLFHAMDTGRIYRAAYTAGTYFWQLPASSSEPVYRARVASFLNQNVSAPGPAINGVNLENGDLVLLKSQINPVENGLYLWEGAAAPLVRAAGWGAGSSIATGTRVIVLEGAVSPLTEWAVSAVNSDPIDFGTATVAFVQANKKQLFGSGSIGGGGTATIQAPIKNDCRIFVTDTDPAAAAIGVSEASKNYPNNQFVVNGTAAHTFDWLVQLAK